MFMFRRNGFTLIEVAVVLVVAGILLAAGLPAFVRYCQTLSQEQAGDVLVQSLRMARQQAVTAHTPIIVAFGDGVQTTGLTTYSVHVDTNGDRVKQAGEAWKSHTLPSGSRFEIVSLIPTDSLIFDSSGALAPSVTGGQITVGGDGNLDTLVVSPTGMVYRR
ncbi:MAG TPA: GspH/FimT family protein [Candidatus Eisenbacteria bacterium]|jgi:type IV fimbrial biogenesis protein FimT